MSARIDLQQETRAEQDAREARAMRDKIERLTERCKSYKGQVEAGAAEIERLRKDVKILLANLDCLQEATTGETLEAEDAAIVEQVRADLSLSKTEPRVKKNAS